MDRLKAEIKKSWDSFICYPKGLIEKTQVKVGEKAFFETIQKERYLVHPYILSLLKELDCQGKRVLEVGCGVGSDLVYLAERGALVTGIDLSPKSITLAKKHCRCFGMKAKLLCADAERLPFRDNSFDIVYSMGVLHHTPMIQKAISEIYRVLNPGSEAIVMLYHKNFFTYWLKLFIINWLVKGNFLRMSFQQTVNSLEYNGCPLVNLFSMKEAGEIFIGAGFEKIKMETFYINQNNIPLIGRCIPQRFLDVLAKKFGFHLVISAKKNNDPKK